jgi:putative nucleotidyltransferase with HDIG domain
MAVSLMKAGAHDYLRKDNLSRLVPAIRREMGEAEVRRQRKQAEEALQQSYKKLRRVLEETAVALASAIEKRDPYTAGHQERVAQLACAIAKAMSFSEELIEGIRVAGVLHDIGKISVPAEILSKPARLTQVEFAIIKTHPQVGYEIVKDIEFPWPVAQMTLQHHERMDGGGYPSGLRGEQILLEARILGVADVVEAISSHRPYRPALGIDKAKEEIVQKRGKLYDPAVVDAVLSVLAQELTTIGWTP